MEKKDAWQMNANYPARICFLPHSSTKLESDWLIFVLLWWERQKKLDCLSLSTVTLSQPNRWQPTHSLPASLSTQKIPNLSNFFWMWFILASLWLWLQPGLHEKFCFSCERLEAITFFLWQAMGSWEKKPSGAHKRWHRLVSQLLIRMLPVKIPFCFVLWSLGNSLKQKNLFLIEGRRCAGRFFVWDNSPGTIAQSRRKFWPITF